MYLTGKIKPPASVVGATETVLRPEGAIVSNWDTVPVPVVAVMVALAGAVTTPA
jgi:hypothetical protein